MSTSGGSTVTDSATRASSPGPVVNILHLTDLHFDAEAPDVDRAQRAIACEALLEKLRCIVDGDEVPSPFGDAVRRPAPDYVVLSGDIAFRAAKEDYAEARKFLDQLLEVVKLSAEQVVAAPGNHDRHIPHAHGLGYPRDAAQCDDWLNPAALAPIDGAQRAALVVPFLNFVDFCREAKYIEPAGIAGLEYLTGVTKIGAKDHEVEFLVVNSAWFAHRAASDMQNMWLGLPLLHALRAPRCEGSSLLPRLSDANQENRLVVGVCHHPREWLHQEEHDSYSDRPNTFRYLAESCNLLLTGHVHGALEPPMSAHNCAQTFTGGATYGRGYFRNNFSLLQVDFADQSVTRAGYEYDPRIAVWQEQAHAAGTYPLFRTGHGSVPDTTITDISGDWSSVFWTEHQPAGRKQYRELTLKRVGGDRYKTARGDFTLDGTLRGGFFSGQWSDSSDTVPLHGAFQLKVHDRNTMVGRWLGFDKGGEIRVGLWRFALITTPTPIPEAGKQ